MITNEHRIILKNKLIEERKSCEVCSSIVDLQVYYKDCNFDNFKRSNLILLCLPCNEKKVTLMSPLNTRKELAYEEAEQIEQQEIKGFISTNKLSAENIKPNYLIDRDGELFIDVNLLEKSNNTKDY